MKKIYSLFIFRSFALTLVALLGVATSAKASDGDTVKVTMTSYDDQYTVPLYPTKIYVVSNNPTSDSVKDEDFTQAMNFAIPEGYAVKASGTVWGTMPDESGTTIINALDIYDRDGESSFDVRNVSGTRDVNFAFNVRNLVFSGDNSEGYTLGFKITLEMVKVDSATITVKNPTDGGTVEPSVTKAVFGDEITVNIKPNAGYYIRSLNAYTLDSKGATDPVSYYDGTWQDSTATFTMPLNADVILEPSFTTRKQATYHLPYADEREVTDTLNLTDTSFESNFIHITDDGGESLDPRMDAYTYTYLVLKAPEGHSVRLTGTVSYDKTLAEFGLYKEDEFLPIPSHEVTGSDGMTTCSIDTVLSSNDVLYVSYYQSGTLNLDLDAVNVLYTGGKPMVISDTADVVVNELTYGPVTLHRKFTAGKWASLILPFDVSKSELSEIFGSDYRIATFENSTEGEISLTSSQSYLERNIPVLIRPSQNVEAAEFSSRNIYPTTGRNFKDGENGINFMGVYATDSIYKSKPEIISYVWYIANNQLWQGNENAPIIKPTRAYFFDNNSYINSFAAKPRISIDGEYLGTVTAINGISTEPSVSDGVVYNLSGVKVAESLEASKLPVGVYIRNGKKIVVK